jgi:hypothetical protein
LPFDNLVTFVTNGTTTQVVILYKAPLSLSVPVSDQVSSGFPMRLIY